MPEKRMVQNPVSQNLLWHGKPYYSLDAYCKNTFGHKLYKTAIDAGFTCPNRDGTLDTRGCIFCSAGGSGDFAASLPGGFGSLPDIPVSLSGVHSTERRITDLLSEAAGHRPGEAPGIIAYFQAYTNTYAPAKKLEPLYRAALDHPETAGISIATRPDCLPPEVLGLLEKLHQEYCIDQYGQHAKFIWIELGLQTIHESGAAYIRRGYPLPVFEDALSALHRIGIPVIVHVILGLPGESREDCLDTVQYLNRMGIFGIKLQLLHVLKGTDLYQDFVAGKFQVLTREEYIDLLIDCISHLRPSIVIHRLTGDGPKDILAAPGWSRRKGDVLNTFHHEMKIRHLYQGAEYRTGYTYEPQMSNGVKQRTEGSSHARSTDSL